MAALSSLARTSPANPADRIGYDRAADQYRVPMFVNDHWVNVGVKFNGSWTDNDPAPGTPMVDGRRDYWPLLYQRAYLQSQNVDTSSLDANRWAVRGTRPDQPTLQNWRYPAIALTSLTGEPSSISGVLTDADKQLLENALHSGRNVIANTSTSQIARSPRRTPGSFTPIRTPSPTSGPMPRAASSCCETRGASMPRPGR